MRYSTLNEFGIEDPDALEWLPMPRGPRAPPEHLSPNEYPEEVPGPLTIAQAKTGLALGLGVPENAIEITVRG